MQILSVTLFSNGIMEVTGEGGTELKEFRDRFCNVWPAISKRVVNEDDIAIVYIADYYGGRIVTNRRALDYFYTNNFEKIS